MEAIDQMYKKYNHSMKMLGKLADTLAIGGLSLVAAVAWFDLSSIDTTIPAPVSEAMAFQASTRSPHVI